MDVIDDLKNLDKKGHSRSNALTPKEIEVVINDINSQEDNKPKVLTEKRSIIEAINQQIKSVSEEAPLAKFGESSVKQPINSKRLFSEVFPSQDNQS